MLAAFGVGKPNAGHPAVLLENVHHPMALPDVDAALGRVIQQELVEDRALHLVRGRAAGDLLEADAPGILGLPPHEAPARLHGEVRRRQLLLQTDLGEDVDRRRDHRFADVVPWERLPFQQEHPVAHLVEEPGNGGPRRSPTDHDDVEPLGHGALLQIQSRAEAADRRSEATEGTQSVAGLEYVVRAKTSTEDDV